MPLHLSTLVQELTAPLSLRLVAGAAGLGRAIEVPE